MCNHCRIDILKNRGPEFDSVDIEVLTKALDHDVKSVGLVSYQKRILKNKLAIIRLFGDKGKTEFNIKYRP